MGYWDPTKHNAAQNIRHFRKCYYWIADHCREFELRRNYISRQLGWCDAMDPGLMMDVTAESIKNYAETAINSGYVTKSNAQRWLRLAEKLVKGFPKVRL